MEKKHLLIEKRNNICILTLNRPEKRNSLSIDLVYDISKTFQELAKNDEIRTVIIRGQDEKAFCAGFDIASLPTSTNPDIQDEFLNENPFELAMKKIKILNLLLKAELNENDRKEAEDTTMLSFVSEDLIEGQTAFLEKRKPKFTGK